VGRFTRLVCFAIVAAVAAPAFGATTRTAAQCAGSVRSGGTASCGRAIVIPHFNARDSIDYSSLVARIDSQASNWRVSGSISDARGVVYFAWYCSAARSSITMRSETHVGRSCGATRKIVTVRRNGRTYTSYYVADTSKPQHLVVTAKNGGCIRSWIRGCRFEAKMVYLLAG